MAPGAIPAPGTKYGPCVDGCDHRDCADMRTAAESPCTICGKPIGYDTMHFRSGDTWADGIEHATCTYEAIEKERMRLSERARGI